MSLQIDIETVFRFRKNGLPQSTAVMLDFLRDIRDTGKLTEASRRSGLSYRHGWNLVNQWSDFFGVPLVQRHKGKGTTLTPFGERLVWAGQRMAARLGPQLENLSQELTSELNPFLIDNPTIIRVHASHGFAVPKLRDILSRTPGMNVDLRYVGNQNSLVSLAHDGCDLAGLHLPRGPLRAASAQAGKVWINSRDHCVIGFVARQMGLMVKRGNPHRISGIEDLTKPEVRFVNRDPDSGTRELFDRILQQHGMRPSAISGYEQIEFTHAAVAAYVASGMADVTFGVEAAARQFGLDFIRVLTEDYYFVCRRSLLETAPMKRILDVMRGAEFQQVLADLPGYTAVDTGMIRTVDDAFAGKPGMKEQLPDGPAE
ncbi:MAG TPA: substrate-binding domain-containing protein [Pseudolabrys sp.]|nr:substrate-binding domain-containing protein [Pseudolabrys sp.]